MTLTVTSDEAIAQPADQPAGVGPGLRQAAPLLLAVACLMAGTGLSSTLLGIRAGLEGFRPSVVGIVLAGFYLGFAAGSLVAPSTIARVGHVRVFAGLASLGSAAILVHVIRPDPFSWFLLRAVSGMCISALYVVSETWLNGVATNRTRGTLFAVYMVVVSGSLLGGQVLFTLADPAGFAVFVLASVLLSMAVVPVSLAEFVAPVIPDPKPLPLRALVKTAPLAVFAAVLAGFVGSAILGGGVVYAAQAGLDQAATGALVGAALLGGALLQIPLGRWSDRVDRRLVILATALVAGIVALLVALIGPSHRLLIIALTMVAGGANFPLYSLSNAHLNDYLDDSLMVAGGARMVLVQGMGAVAGPIVGALVVGQIGPGALFVSMAIAYGLIAAFALVRVFMRAAVPEEDRAEFTPVAVGFGATASGFDADLDDLFPPVDGTVEVDGRQLSYRVQGQEDVDVVVLLGAPPGRSDPWVGVLPAMAWDGLRAVTAWDPDRPGEALRTDDVLGLLRELELPSASYVAAGSSRELARTLASEHPDRTDAVALIQVASDKPDQTAETPVLDPQAEEPTVDPEAEQPTPELYPLLLIDPAAWDDAEHLADEIAALLQAR